MTCLYVYICVCVYTYIYSFSERAFRPGTLDFRVINVPASRAPPASSTPVCKQIWAPDEFLIKIRPIWSKIYFLFVFLTFVFDISKLPHAKKNHLHTSNWGLSPRICLQIPYFRQISIWSICFGQKSPSAAPHLLWPPTPIPLYFLPSVPSHWTALCLGIRTHTYTHTRSKKKRDLRCV